jgi:hypothetical protein
MGDKLGPPLLPAPGKAIGNRSGYLPYMTEEPLPLKGLGVKMRVFDPKMPMHLGMSGA